MTPYLRASHTSPPHPLRLALLCLGLLAVLQLPVLAQSSTPNIALQSNGCIATHVGGGQTTTGYGPELYNDGNIPPLDATGTYLWGWFTSGVGNWMQFDWGTTPRTFDEITLYFAQSNTRQLQGGSIQIWNGTTWITHHTFPDLGIIASGIRVITFPAVTTTMVRVVYASGGSNPNFREVQIRYSVTAPNDAGVASIDSPLNFCAGTLPISITLQNFGTNRITSATINWRLNGMLQTPVAWTGLLDTLNATTRRASVTLHPGYTFVANTPYTIQVWTSGPNGVSDPNTANDSMTVTRKAAMSGTFTIGGSGATYPTFAAAITDLNLNGVCGPVVYNVRTGVYSEQVSLNAVSGASATNTITFQSETGNKNDVRLTFAATTTTMHTLMLNGAKWARFRNMTIEGTGATYARPVTIQGASSDNIFEGNIIRTNPTTSVSTNICNIYCYYTGDNNIQFINNDILNASYSTYIYGSGTTTLLNGWKMTNNRIENWYYMGLVMWYMNAPEIIGNRVATNNTYTNYVGYLGYLQNQVKVIGNSFIANGTTGTKYGLYVYYYTAAAGLEGKVQNNFVMLNGGASTVYGIYSYYSNNQDIDFNTVFTKSTSTSTYPLYSYYGTNIRYTNNIFYNNATGYTAYWYYTTYRNTNYNVYYTNGTNLALWNGAVQTGLANLQTISGQNQNSIVRPVVFRDPDNGDLHLSGTSQNDLLLTGLLQPDVSKDIDNDPRILPYRGADEACYILPNTVTYRFVDGENQDVTYANIPGTINVAVNVAFPAMGFPLTVTVNFYTVPGNQLAYTTSFNATKLPGQTLAGTYQVAVPPTLQQGYYRMNVVFTTQNSCGDFINYVPGDKAMLLVGQGQTPCIVWPGDVNNDGIANYGDRAALNKYIFDANLRASWLTGPARYRADYLTNPMTYFTWEGQAGAPWQTADGCFMDADGNGAVNNWDLLPVKVNFLRTHGLTPKAEDGALAGSFGLSQNYPNPFNPSTTLQYAVPEKSTVTLVVTDMLGREIAVLVNGEVEAGVRTVVFDASALESGVYMARYEATGIASGITSSRTIKMTLTK